MTAVTITQTQTAEVDGLRIRYADSGTAAGGPVIVFTSPWPESLFAFRRVWPALSAAGRLVAVDLPGFGHSQGRRDVLTPSAMGEFLYQFIGALGLGRPPGRTRRGHRRGAVPGGTASRSGQQHGRGRGRSSGAA